MPPFGRVKTTKPTEAVHLVHPQTGGATLADRHHRLRHKPTNQLTN